MKKKHSHSRMGKWFLAGIAVILIFIAELFLYTWCRVQCISVGYDISNLKKEYQQQLALQKKLNVEIAHLKSPTRIADIAVHKIGLQMPTPEQTIVIP